MCDYWRTHYDSNPARLGTSLLMQVGKTVNGVEITDAQLQVIVETVKNRLALDPADTIADLCCGNGVVTLRIAPFVKAVIGLDFSKELLSWAQNSQNAENVRFENGDVRTLSGEFFKESNKIMMYEGLQHLVESDLVRLLEVLRSVGLPRTIFFGGVPDIDRLRHYYDTDDKYAFFLQSEKEGRPHMGKWWSREEMMEIGSKGGADVEVREQETFLYTAYYRFDCIMKVGF